MLKKNVIFIDTKSNPESWAPVRNVRRQFGLDNKCIYTYIADEGNNQEGITMKDHEEPGYCTCLNLRKAARAVTQYFDDVLRPSGLRATQFSLLVMAKRLGPISIKELAEKLIVDRTTLTRNLRILEEKRLVTVNPGKDGRTRLVFITAGGRGALKKAAPLWKKAQSHMVAGLGRRRFSSLLDVLADSVVLSRAG